MTLQKDVVSIPLLKGINTKTDPQQEQVGSLIKLRDVKFTKIGSIEKRSGYESLGKDISFLTKLSTDYRLNLIDPLAVRASGDSPVVITKNLICKYTKADKKIYATTTYAPLHFQELPRPNDNDLHVNAQTIIFGDFCYLAYGRVTQGGMIIAYIQVSDISTPTPTILVEPLTLALNMTGTAFPNSVDGGSTFGAFSHTNAVCYNVRLAVHRGRLIVTVTDSSGNLFFKTCDPYDITQVVNRQMSAISSGLDGGWIPVFDGGINNTYNVYDIASDNDGMILLATKTVSSDNTIARKFGGRSWGTNSNHIPFYYSWRMEWGWTDTATAVSIDRVKLSAPGNYSNQEIDGDIVLTLVDDNKITIMATDKHYDNFFEWTNTLTAGINTARHVSVVVNDNLYTYPTIDPSTTNAGNQYLNAFVSYRKSGDPTLANIDHIQFYDNTSGTQATAYLTTNNFASGTLDDVREGDWSTIAYSDLEPWLTDYIVAWEIVPDSTSYSTPLFSETDENFKLGVGIAGRAFQIRWGEADQRDWDAATVPFKRKSGQWIQPFSSESRLGSAYYLLALAGPYNNIYGPYNSDETGLKKYSNWTGVLAYGIGGGDLETGNAGVPSLSSVPYYNRHGNKSVFFPYTVQSRVTTEDVTSEAAAYTAFYNTESATVTKISYDPGVPNQSAEIADSLFIPGGMVNKYQAGQTHEAGFLQSPHRLYLYLGGATAMTEVSTASPKFEKGNIYNYVAVYADRDSSGRVSKSSLSQQLQVTITNTGTNTGYEGINLLVPMNVLTNRVDNGLHDIEVYRTTNNGTVFYKVSGQNSTLTHPYLLNDENQYMIAFRDEITDDDLTNNELLYTTGGLLENTPGPACSIMEVYKNMVFMAGLENNPYAIQYTKTVSYNTTLDFNDTLLFETPTVGGPITTLKGMDDKLFIFKNTSIYFVAGGQNNFTSYLRTKSGQMTNIELAILSGDIGCVNKNSCVLTPIGIMFQSNRGIYLINRANLTLEYIGAPVQAYNHLQINDATLYAKVGEVRFITRYAETLIYNFERDVWYTFSNLSGNSQAVINDEFYLVSDKSLLLKEVEHKYTDLGSPITVELETGWMSFNKVQGFQRVYRMLILGNYKSKHQVKVRVAYDFDDTWVDEYTVEMTDIDTVFYGSDDHPSTANAPSHPYKEYFDSEKYGGPEKIDADNLGKNLTKWSQSGGWTFLSPMDGGEGQPIPGVLGDDTTSYHYAGDNGGTTSYPYYTVGYHNPLWDASQGYATNQNQYQFRINLKRQKCESIKISIETLQDSNQGGEGATFSNISFLVGLKKGDYRIKQSRVKGVQ